MNNLITEEGLLRIGFHKSAERFYNKTINYDSYIYCNKSNDTWDIGIATQYEDEDGNDDETYIELDFIYITQLEQLVHLLTYKKQD